MLVSFGLVLSLLIGVSLSLSAVARSNTSFEDQWSEQLIVEQTLVPNINRNKQAVLHSLTM